MTSRLVSVRRVRMIPPCWSTWPQAVSRQWAVHMGTRQKAEKRLIGAGETILSKCDPLHITRFDQVLLIVNMPTLEDVFDVESF